MTTNLHTADILEVTDWGKIHLHSFFKHNDNAMLLLHFTLSHATPVFCHTVFEKHSLMYAGGLCSPPGVSLSPCQSACGLQRGDLGQPFPLLLPRKPRHESSLIHKRIVFWLGFSRGERWLKYVHAHLSCRHKQFRLGTFFWLRPGSGVDGAAGVRQPSGVWVRVGECMCHQPYGLFSC